MRTFRNDDTLYQLEHIEAIEKRLWTAADTLRANSEYASNEHFLPVMGLVFLRHAYSRYLAVKIRRDPRLPFGLPGVNKKGNVSNGNYVWISYFYRYLNETGRAGFVMSSQASCAGGSEAQVRRKLVDRAEIEANDWSLAPGRHVGVAPEEDENFDFAKTMREIHEELDELNAEAVILAARIKKNFEELGV